MAVRSKWLFGPTVVGAADVVLYTCPKGETTLLKHLTIVNNAALNNNVSIRINGTTNGAAIARKSVASGQDDSIVGAFIVLQPGDVLHAQATSASAIVAGFGAQLEGVAD